ncbi:uncharacterized protein ACR2FA_008126 [Aphomia sociella]
MALTYLVFTLLFVSLVYGNNSTELNINKTTPSAKHSQEDSSSTKATIISEGGPISPLASASTLPKENHTNLLSLDKELGKNKERPVVPRKGVQYPPPEEKDNVSNSSSELHADTKQNTAKIETAPVSVENNLKKDHETKEKNNDVKTVSTTKRPPKPTVLSYEALEGMDQHAKSEPISVKSSSESVINQIPNPNANSNIKIQSMSTNHPDLIMPVVITVLTVPLFAVLGYMALRRGQEAWKNRHYKRMDFLLDGMYND